MEKTKEIRFLDRLELSEIMTEKINNKVGKDFLNNITCYKIGSELAYLEGYDRQGNTWKITVKLFKNGEPTTVDNIRHCTELENKNIEIIRKNGETTFRKVRCISYGKN